MRVLERVLERGREGVRRCSREGVQNRHAVGLAISFPHVDCVCVHAAFLGLLIFSFLCICLYFVGSGALLFFLWLHALYIRTRTQIPAVNPSH